MTTLFQSCRGCGNRKYVQAHHVIPKKHLKKLDEEIVWDPANGMCLCEKCHSRHTSRHRPITRKLLEKKHFKFAEEHNLTWLLEREYPEE